MSRTRTVASALVLWIALQLSSSPAALGRGDRTAPRFKAVAFDYFVLFDPDSVVSHAEELFPGKGRQLTTLWRNRQFEYTWLRSVAHRYIDFSALAWMPAASIYFHDPDGHLLEYIAMLPEDPRPDRGVLKWHEWTQR